MRRHPTWHTLGNVTYPNPLTNSSVTAIAMFPVIAVGDPVRTRTVLAAIFVLIAIGVGLIALAAWLIRSTRVDPEVLAPLEVMSERSWRRADPVWQRRRLDEVRPDEAEPLDPTIPPPPTDAEFDEGPRLGDFDDFDDLLRRFGVDLDDAAPAAVAPDEQAPDSEPPVDEAAFPDGAAANDEAVPGDAAVIDEAAGEDETTELGAKLVSDDAMGERD